MPLRAIDKHFRLSEMLGFNCVMRPPRHQSPPVPHCKIHQRSHAQNYKSPPKIDRGRYRDPDPTCNRKISNDACGTFRQQRQNAAGDNPFCELACRFARSLMPTPHQPPQMRTAVGGPHSAGFATRAGGDGCTAIHDACTEQHEDAAFFGSAYSAFGSTK